MTAPDLAYLQSNWGEAYEITEALGVWRAVRLDNQRVILGRDASELHTLIVDDYIADPVRRDRGDV